MKNIDKKNIFILFKNEIKVNQRSLLIFIIAISGIMMLYMLLFPMVKDIFIDKLDSMPLELLEMFGVSGASEFTNYNTYFGSMAGIFSLVIAIYMLLFSVNIFYKEEETKTIEYTFSNAISREELWISKFLTLIVSLLLICIMIFLVATISGFLSSPKEIEVKALLGISFLMFSISFIFVSLGLLLISFKMKYRPLSLGLGILFTLYLLGYLGSIGGRTITFLRYLSPFTAIAINDFANSVVNLANYNYLALIVYYFIAISFIVISVICYRKKDFS